MRTVNRKIANTGNTVQYESLVHFTHFLADNTKPELQQIILHVF